MPDDDRLTVRVGDLLPETFEEFIEASERAERNRRAKKRRAGGYTVAGSSADDISRGELRTELVPDELVNSDREREILALAVIRPHDSVVDLHKAAENVIDQSVTYGEVNRLVRRLRERQEERGVTHAREGGETTTTAAVTDGNGDNDDGERTTTMSSDTTEQTAETGQTTDSVQDTTEQDAALAGLAESRRAVYEALRDGRGETAKEISEHEDVDYPYGTVAPALTDLYRERLVNRTRESGTYHYQIVDPEAGVEPPTDPDADVYGGPTESAVKHTDAEFIETLADADDEGLTTDELVEQFDLTRSAILRRLRRLRDEGRVRRESEGRSHRWFDATDTDPEDARNIPYNPDRVKEPSGSKPSSRARPPESLASIAEGVDGDTEESDEETTVGTIARSDLVDAVEKLGPEARTSDIAHETGGVQRTVRRHLFDLEDEGEIASKRPGKSYLWSIPDEESEPGPEAHETQEAPADSPVYVEDLLNVQQLRDEVAHYRKLAGEIDSDALHAHATGMEYVLDRLTGEVTESDE